MGFAHSLNGERGAWLRDLLGVDLGSEYASAMSYIMPDCFIRAACWDFSVQSEMNT